MGTAVDVWWAGEGRYYRGAISGRQWRGDNGCLSSGGENQARGNELGSFVYDIEYDDGDTEMGVSAELLRVIDA